MKKQYSREDSAEMTMEDMVLEVKKSIGIDKSEWSDEILKILVDSYKESSPDALKLLDHLSDIDFIAISGDLNEFMDKFHEE